MATATRACPCSGGWMATAGAELLADADVILPVPLYRSRLWSRRFNQSAMLGQAVGGLTGMPVDCFLLARVKRMHAQVGLTAAQRRKNVAGAFRVTAARGALRGKRIVVVDDVITAEACARSDAAIVWNLLSLTLTYRRRSNGQAAELR